MSFRNRDEAFRSIRSNISNYGHHIYLVTATLIPRFAYTIGLSNFYSAELILAGASYFSADDIKVILNQAAAEITKRSTPTDVRLQIDSLGSFTLRSVHKSWSDLLLLGAKDFLNADHLNAWQIVPDESHWTLDIPDLKRPWNDAEEPCWRWLTESWNYAIPENSVATTNLEALRGSRITEAARWERDQWELFAGAGPDIEPKDVRMVPLATLLAIDQSLDAVTNLQLGASLWRDKLDGEWRLWS